MATGINGIATVNDLVVGKGLSSPPGYPANQCPPKEVIISMGGSVSNAYASNQLVKYPDVQAGRELILYNWGSVPIYNIQFTLENTSSSTIKEVVYLGGQTIAAGGGYSLGSHGMTVINSGTGTIRVVDLIIVNGESWTGTGKINLSRVTNLTGGTQPTTWTNSLPAYYLISNEYKLKIDLKFP